jgi:hypothetical protein
MMAPLKRQLSTASWMADCLQVAQGPGHLDDFHSAAIQAPGPALPTGAPFRELLTFPRQSNQIIFAATDPLCARYRLTVPVLKLLNTRYFLCARHSATMSAPSWNNGNWY